MNRDDLSLAVHVSPVKLIGGLSELAGRQNDIWYPAITPARVHLLSPGQQRQKAIILSEQEECSWTKEER